MALLQEEELKEQIWKLNSSNGHFQKSWLEEKTPIDQWFLHFFENDHMHPTYIQ
jgi:hypothetical protein